MKGRLTLAQRALLEQVKQYQRTYGPGPTLTMVGTMVNGTPLEVMLPRLLADGWLAFDLTSNYQGKSMRVVAKR